VGAGNTCTCCSCTTSNGSKLWALEIASSLICELHLSQYAKLDHMPNSQQYQWDPWCVNLLPSNQGGLVHYEQPVLINVR
jgi:hypothetical protein